MGRKGVCKLFAQMEAIDRGLGGGGGGIFMLGRLHLLFLMDGYMPHGGTGFLFSHGFPCNDSGHAAPILGEWRHLNVLLPNR